MSFFNQLCGFDQTALAQLSDRDNRHLDLSSLLSLLGIIFCSLSAFYLFYACTDSFFPALIAAVIVFLILYNLLVVLISGASYPIFQQVSEEVRQTPRWTRLVIFLLISLAFTQPMMVFLLEHSPLSKKIDSKLDQRNELNTQVIRKNLESFENKKLREIALLSEHYNRLITQKYGDEEDIDQVLPISNQSGRKALLIGNQAYGERSLENPKKDATDLATVLRTMGFEVIVQTDLDRVRMERTIDAYVSTLGPRDISLFYFSGHGFMDEGNNYLMPIGMKSDSRSEAIGLNINIEKIFYYRQIAKKFGTHTKNVGLNLALTMINEVSKNGYQAIFCQIIHGPIKNAISINFHTKLGFKCVGEIYENNYLRGIYCFLIS